MIALCAIMLLVAMLLNACSLSNRQLGPDVALSFNQFILNIGDKTVVGTVQSWRDFENSDVVQFTDSNGSIYLTHYSNVVLIRTFP